MTADTQIDLSIDPIRINLDSAPAEIAIEAPEPTSVALSQTIESASLVVTGPGIENLVGTPRPDISIEPPTPLTIELDVSGPPGPEGPTGPTGAEGPQGPPGPSGGSTTYTHVQSMSASVWTINHNLDRFPAIEVVDSAGSVVIGSVHYVSSNTMTVSFVYQFSGRAYLNG